MHETYNMVRGQHRNVCMTSGVVLHARAEAELFDAELFHASIARVKAN